MPRYTVSAADLPIDACQSDVTEHVTLPTFLASSALPAGAKSAHQKRGAIAIVPVQTSLFICSCRRQFVLRPSFFHFSGDLPIGVCQSDGTERITLLLLSGDLPYLLALDRPTKSVVLAIRGTVSVADLATDMLADPEPMEEWLPDTMAPVCHNI